MKTKISNKNDLRRARKRRGLEQKQVAFLLDHKTPAEVSRYETGFYLPGLKTLLKLEVIYHMPIRIMFRQLFEECQNEINERIRQNQKLLSDPNWFPKHAEQLKQEEFCFYANLLKDCIPNEIELLTVQKHSVNLINTISLYKQGINPYP